MQQQAGRRGEEYSATCVCVRGRARACVDEAVPQTITEGVTATVGVLVYMIEGFAEAVLGPTDPPQNAKKQMEGNR